MLPFLADNSTSTAHLERRGCLRCEVLPDAVEVSGDLHCWCPATHVAGKLRTALSELHLTTRPSPAGGVAYNIPSDKLDAVIAVIRERLTDVECQDTRALMTKVDASPVPEDLARVESLSRLHDVVLSAHHARRRSKSYLWARGVAAGHDSDR